MTDAPAVAIDERIDIGIAVAGQALGQQLG